MTLNPEQESLVLDATQVKRALGVAEDRVAALRNESVIMMRKLHDAGVSWAEIARIHNMTPQAAMYATGHAQRTPRSSPANAKTRTASPASPEHS